MFSRLNKFSKVGNISKIFILILSATTITLQKLYIIYSTMGLWLKKATYS